MEKRTIREIGDDDYQYVPLGKYIVCAPSVCRGRPTFKNTRIEVAGVLKRLGAGHTIAELVTGYRGRISESAIQEAIALAAKALVQHAPTPVAS